MENTIRTQEGPILAQVRRFSAAHGKELTVAGGLDRGLSAILGAEGIGHLWLTGGDHQWPSGR